MEEILTEKQQRSRNKKFKRLEEPSSAIDHGLVVIVCDVIPMLCSLLDITILQSWSACEVCQSKSQYLYGKKKEKETSFDLI